MRASLVCIGAALAAVVVLPAPGAAAGSREDSVAGAVVRVSGVTREKASFAGRSRRPDFMDLRFGADEFSAPGVSGRYLQTGRMLSFRVDPILLERYAESWAAAYGDSLRGDGLDPDEVHCEVAKARLRGRSRGGEVKIRSRYEIRCVARGDFGVVDARGSVRFRGRGQISERLNLPLSDSGTAGLAWNLQQIAIAPTPPEGPPEGGTAGSTLEMVPSDDEGIAELLAELESGR